MRGRLPVPKVLKIQEFFKGVTLSNLEDEVDKLKFLSTRIKTNIESLKMTAKQNKLVSLSPNCVNVPLFAAFVIHETPKEGKWIGGEYKEGEYREYLNPEILEASKEKSEGVERCPSFPVLSSVVSRSQTVKVRYETIARDIRIQTLQGFKARVFQHEVDHLDGISLVQWQRNLGRLHLDPGLSKDFSKIDSILHSYSCDMARLLKEHPQLSEADVTNPPHISFFRDFVRRLSRHFQRQYPLYEAREALK